MKKSIFSLSLILVFFLIGISFSQVFYVLTDGARNEIAKVNLLESSWEQQYSSVDYANYIEVNDQGIFLGTASGEIFKFNHAGKNPIKTYTEQYDQYNHIDNYFINQSGEIYFSRDKDIFKFDGTLTKILSVDASTYSPHFIIDEDKLYYLTGSNGDLKLFFDGNITNLLKVNYSTGFCLANGMIYLTETNNNLVDFFEFNPVTKEKTFLFGGFSNVISFQFSPQENVFYILYEKPYSYGSFFSVCNKNGSEFRDIIFPDIDLGRDNFFKDYKIYSFDVYNKKIYLLPNYRKYYSSWTSYYIDYGSEYSVVEFDMVTNEHRYLVPRLGCQQESFVYNNDGFYIFSSYERISYDNLLGGIFFCDKQGEITVVADSLRNITGGTLWANKLYWVSDLFYKDVQNNTQGYYCTIQNMSPEGIHNKLLKYPQIQSISVNEYIFFSVKDSLYCCDLDGKNKRLLLTTNTGNNILDTDVRQDKIYWLDDDGNIEKADKDGKNRQRLTSSISYYKPICFAVFDSRIVWADEKYFWSSDLDGGGFKQEYECSKILEQNGYRIIDIKSLDMETSVSSTQVVSLPTKSSLSQNYPNPFNPITTIDYELPQSGQVELSIFNLTGQKVATLVKESQSAGNYSVIFDGTNLPSGVYFYKLTAGEFIEIKKIMLIK